MEEAEFIAWSELKNVLVSSHFVIKILTLQMRRIHVSCHLLSLY